VTIIAEEGMGEEAWAGVKGHLLDSTVSNC